MLYCFIVFCGRDYITKNLFLGISLYRTTLKNVLATVKWILEYCYFGAFWDKKRAVLPSLLAAQCCVLLDLVVFFFITSCHIAIAPKVYIMRNAEEFASAVTCCLVPITQWKRTCAGNLLN